MISHDVADVAAARLQSRSSFAHKCRRMLWGAVQGTLFKYSLHNANGFRVWLLRLFGASVGRRCTVRRTARVYYPWLLSMGHLSTLGDDSVVYNLATITLGDRVTVSQEAYLCAGTHDYRTLAMPLVTHPIRIGDDAWICARAFVGPGLDVGEGAILGAASVATQHLEPWTIYGGNPARPIKSRPRLDGGAGR
jgi:putative colanic acid biosynthesis acetyltransferase WcaF